MNEIGKKIKELRVQKNMSQFELEAAIETSAGRISKIENGKINPNKETLARIIEALDLSVYDAAYLYQIPFQEDFEDLMDLIKKLQTNLDLFDLADKILLELKKKIDAISIGLFFWNDETNELQLYAFSNNPRYRKFLKSINVDVSYKLCFQASDPESKLNIFVRAINENRTIFSSDPYDFVRPLFSKQIAHMCKKILGMKIAAVIPLCLNGEKIGVISVSWKRDFITDGEKYQLEYIANQIAISLYNAKIYSNLKKKYKLLKEGE